MVPDLRAGIAGVLVLAAAAVSACSSSVALTIAPVTKRTFAVQQRPNTVRRPVDRGGCASLACRSVGPARSAREEAVDARCAIGLLGRAVAESGRFGHGDGDHGQGDGRRRAFMLTILLDRTDGRWPISTVSRNEHTGHRDTPRHDRVTVSGFRARRRNGGTGGKSATGQGEPSARICTRLRIGALERGIDSPGLELFTFDSTTGEGSQ
jgi:hypothetical protein